MRKLDIIPITGNYPSGFKLNYIRGSEDHSKAIRAQHSTFPNDAILELRWDRNTRGDRALAAERDAEVGARTSHDAAVGPYKDDIPGLRRVELDVLPRVRDDTRRRAGRNMCH